MGARTLNREEWKVMEQLIRLGGEATANELILRGRQAGWQHVNVTRALLGMQRKGYLAKGLDVARNVTYRRIGRQEPLLHELAFGTVGPRYWGTCSCGWRRWARAGDVAGEDDVRERAFQHPERWPNRRWGPPASADMTSAVLAPLRFGSINKP
jgi:hypothetical protein